jgi:iron complex transport system permease protein
VTGRACAGLAALLVVLGVVALTAGRPVIGLGALPGALTSPDLTGVLLRELRIPRLLLGVLAGTAMACAGLVLQEALRNPLAAPDLVGVSSGAAFAVALVVVTGTALALPAAALAGGLLGGALTLVATRRAPSPAAALLIGAAVSAALQAAFLAAFALAGELQTGQLFRYLLGSLAGRRLDDLAAVAPWLLVVGPALVACAPVLAVLRLGDDTAGALGVRVGRARAAAMAIAVLLVGPVVGVCGPVAWVLAPHLARRLVPDGDALRWMPVTALCGAVVVVAADLAGRFALAPIETPLGAWTAVAGVLGGLLLARRRTEELV